MSNQRTIKVAPDATITLTVEARGDTGCTRFEWWAKMAASTGKPFHRYVEGRVTTDSRHGYSSRDGARADEVTR